MAIDLKDIITMTELRTNLAEIVNEVHNLRNKKVVTVNGKPAIQIQNALKAEDIENEIKELRKENDVLKTLLGIKRGLEAYLKGEFVDHEVAEKRFEKYITDIQKKK